MSSRARAWSALRRYSPAVAAVGLATLIGAGLMEHIERSEIIMIYLLGIMAVSASFGRGPALLASTLSVAAFDFCFVPPYHTLRVTDTRFVLTFAAMFIVGIVISGLSAQVKSQAERALRAEKEALRSALLSSLSHDLRTPLCAIAGAASTLLDEEHPLPRGGQRELLTTIYDEADHLNRLVRNLLDMTRLEAGGLQVKKEWMPLEEVVGAALARLERRLAAHPVRVSLPKDLPLLPIDGLLIEQVFYNLLENAAKYTPAGTAIEISARAAGAAVCVEVSDAGPGVPQEDQARIFDKFFRGAAKPSDGGVGLGLTICRGIVAAHDGSIGVSSRPGGGAVFRFTLPIAGQAPGLPPDERLSSVGGTAKGGHD